MLLKKLRKPFPAVARQLSNCFHQFDGKIMLRGVYGGIMRSPWRTWGAYLVQGSYPVLLPLSRFVLPQLGILEAFRPEFKHINDTKTKFPYLIIHNQ